MAEPKKLVVPVTPAVSEAEKAKKLAEKSKKFKEIADKRMGKTLQSMRLLTNLASPNYVYTDDQAAKIVDALQKEVDAIFDAFKAKKGKDKVTFSL